MVIETKDATAAELMDVKGVAQLLACSTRHVLRQADAGRMPLGLKLGGLRRWRRTQILEWLDAGCPAVRAMKGGAR